MKLIKLFLVNAAVLTASALVMRTIDFSFNVYVSSSVGTVGMGLYSLIMSVYSFAVTFATSGINLAVTRIISEAIGTGDNKKIRKSVLCCILYSLVLGTCSGAALFIFANKIGIGILGDQRTVSSLKLLSLSCVFLSVSSAFSGYFTSVRRVYKNAAISFFEQLLRIAVTVAAFRRLGMGNIEYACVSLCAGLVISECISFLITFILYVFDVKKSKYTYSDDKLPVKKLLSITVPVAVSSYVRSGLVTLEHILIPRGLKKSGSSYDAALSSYGVLHGMAFPVIFFPQVLLSSFSALLIPELTQNQARDDKKHINYIIGRIVQVTLLYSVFVSAVLIAFGGQIGNAVYHNAECGKYIRLTAPLIPVMYLDTSIDTMLKGLGEQFYSMCVNIVDAALSVLMVFLLVPKYGVMGYIVTVYVCETLNFSLSITRLTAKTRVKLDMRKYLVMPLLSAIGTCALISLLMHGANIVFSENIYEPFAVIAFSALVYVFMICVNGTLSKDDRKWIRSIIK